MIRSVILCGAVLLLSCSTTPLGLCEDDSACLPGLRCELGVCVGCGGDDECKAWEACTSDRRCELREGMCVSAKDCENWEVCGVGHACQPATGACGSTADCRSFETCDTAAKKCVFQTNRCDADDDCGGDSLWAQTCDAEHWCHSSTTANDVFLWGTLMEGACYLDAISNVMTPERVQVGFDCDTNGFQFHGVLAPDGRVRYVDWGLKPRRIRTFIPDAFTHDKDGGHYPSNGNDNDPILPAPGCDASADIASFILQAGTGEVAYSCGAYGPGTKYYNLAGAVVQPGPYRLLSWNASDVMLVRDDFDSISVMSPSRSVLGIQGLELTGDILMDVRAHATGFLVAVRVPDQAGQLWHISNEGTATLLTNYGGLPPGAYTNPWGVLDSTGALFQTGGSVGYSGDVILRRPADGSTATVVYAESNAPEIVNVAAKFGRLYNMIHGAYLFTPP